MEDVKFELRFSSRSWKDLADIEEYIYERCLNLGVVEQFEEFLLSECVAISRNPFAGSDRSTIGRHIRLWVAKTATSDAYRIYYRIRPNARRVEILRIGHQGLNPDNLF